MLLLQTFLSSSILLSHLIYSQIQINFHLTQWLKYNDNIQHNCLYFSVPYTDNYDERHILSFCMSELPSKFNIKPNNDIDQIYTFNQLVEKNVTIEQLYQWSASIDLIEQYQVYLNDRKSLLGNETFYNCTLPYFGPQCQYVFKDLNYSKLSLDKMIEDYYYLHEYEPMLFTCYEHLKCNRGPSSACLDWTEICDEKIDCLDGGLDEEHCWQLGIVNECDRNQYQCYNGQCIPKTFGNENKFSLDCIDQSDERAYTHDTMKSTIELFQGPTFYFEDVLCIKLYLLNMYPSGLRGSSCVENRQKLISYAIFSIKPNSLSDECWTAFKCIVHVPIIHFAICKLICHYGFCKQILKTECPNLIDVSATPFLYDHVNLIINKNDLTLTYDLDYKPQIKYICFDRQRLHINDRYMNFSSLNNQTCFTNIYSEIHISSHINYWPERYFLGLYTWFLKNSAIIENNHLSIYTNSNSYQCNNSPKRIPNYRLRDSILDCPDNDDESPDVSFSLCLTNNTKNFFQCPDMSCISSNLINDDACDCPLDTKSKNCADEDRADFNRMHTSIFQKICNYHPDIFNPHSNLYLTASFDEINCNHWPLVHVYNYCDGYFDNKNGSDELNCDPSSPMTCPSNHYLCISQQTHQFICLPINKINNEIVDCFGAFDEPKYYQNHNQQLICISARTQIEQFLCKQYTNRRPKENIKYFTLDQRMNFTNEQKILDKSSEFKNFDRKSYHQRCHRGLDLDVYLDKSKNLTTSVCLCPPSYYGRQCQFQNQRISLTLQFRASSDSVRIPFIIIISLVDNSQARTIHSTEQITFLSSIHCQKKFHMYLLYSTRPKDSSNEYFLHIDVYEKITLKYRASFFEKIQYLFLPVHRLSYILTIPPERDSTESCSDRQCFHGQCIQYANDLTNQTFCQCHHGWSGETCSIKYDCQCSSDALCLGQSANNRSVCVCPLHRKGPRCLIEDKICDNQTCSNRGQCVSLDEYQKSFICICEQDYSNDQFCQFNQTKLIVSFNENIHLPTTIFIHFIEIKFQSQPARTTTVKTIYPGQHSMNIRWSFPFHLVFIQFDNQTYYLALLQKTYQPESIVQITVQISDRCLHIRDLFNQTITNSRLIDRIKYYHLPCQRSNLDLRCFYDDFQLCLCQQVNDYRVANCLDFNHRKGSICTGINACKNGGICHQEDNDCSRISICQCPTCFYGPQCELTTNSFNLSLDALLAFTISPNLSFDKQPSAVFICLCVTIVLVCLGLINACCSLITFKNPCTRQSGCGVYLLCSSIVTFWTLLFFLLKFIIVLLSQIGIIKNYSFLTIQCNLLDFLLRSCFNLEQWLTAFVAIERAIISMKGVYFQQQKAKFYSKWIILCSIFFIILTNIHDPFCRRLFQENDDEQQQRYWCIVEYQSTFLYIYNSLIAIFHFILPFIINFISAIIIIFSKTKQQIIIDREKQDRKSHLKDVFMKQIQQHKNLLIAPCVLTILGIPRLIMSFTSSCMTSEKDFWFYLSGYYISLIPSLLTFTIFVLPSSTYKQAFRLAMNRFF